jgi:prepilin-type N-terminal cleavage/methylation domain-containing protein
MRNRKGFTLIELMVVVLIVAVLAAIIVPMMTSRINSAKWSEARAAMGQIATALRAYAAENETTTLIIVNPGDGTASLGFKLNELDGKYFATADYSITSASYDTDNGTMDYIIQADISKDGAPTGGPLIMTCTANETSWNF